MDHATVVISVSLSDPPSGLVDLITTRAEGPSPAPPHLGGDQKKRAADNGEAIRRYALAALDNQIKSVEGAGRGTRNQALNNAALSLGHLVGAGALTEHTLRAALEGASHANGLVKDDGIASVRGTISSGLKAGIAQAVDLSKIGQRARPSRPASSSLHPPEQQSGAPQLQRGRGDDATALNRRLASFKLTDVGNVERFLARYGEAFRWCPAIGWLTWTGKVWSAVDTVISVNRIFLSVCLPLAWKGVGDRGVRQARALPRAPSGCGA
jgi:putative DNA primase/helicase